MTLSGRTFAGRCRTLLITALIGLPPVLRAAGTEPVVIDGQAYSVPEELASAGVPQTFAAVDRIDESPTGHVAIAVRFDPEDPGQGADESAPCDLLVIDLEKKKVVREIWAWRTTTYAGKWRDDGLYHFFGGPPADAERPEFRYDPGTNLVDDSY